MSNEQFRRAVIRAFPERWRAEHEDALLATMADLADERGGWLQAIEVLNVLCVGLRMRIGTIAARTAPRPVAGDDIEQRQRALSGDDLGAGQAGAISGVAVLALTALAATVLLRGWSDVVSLEFLLTSLVVVIVPGTGVVYTVACALSGGWRRGLFAALGCTFGIVPHMAAAMLGLSGVMQAGAAAFEVVRWVGVAYLIFMGISMIRNGGAMQLEVEGQSTDRSMIQIVRRGVLLNLLNPKLTLFFFAFLPQFLTGPPGLFDLRLIGLGAIFMAMTFLVFAVYAYASASVRERVLGEPAVLRLVQGALGTVLVGFAARLAFADR